MVNESNLITLTFPDDIEDRIGDALVRALGREPNEVEIETVKDIIPGTFDLSKVATLVAQAANSKPKRRVLTAR